MSTRILWGFSSTLLLFTAAAMPCWAGRISLSASYPRFSEALNKYNAFAAKREGDIAAMHTIIVHAPKLREFDQHLQSKARDEQTLLSCVTKMDSITGTLHGQRVYASPAELTRCNQALNDFHSAVFDGVLATLNTAFKTSYPAARTLSDAGEQWQRASRDIPVFKSDCQASISQALTGQLRQRRAVVQANRAQCGAAWVRALTPVRERAETLAAANERMQVSPEGWCDVNQLLRTEEDEDDITLCFYPATKGSAASKKHRPDDELEADLAALGQAPRGASTPLTGQEASAHQAIQARRVAGAGLVSGLEQGVIQQPKAGEIGGVTIIGGSTGKLLEGAMSLSPTFRGEKSTGKNSSNAIGCDDQQYARQAQQFAQERAAATKNMSTQRQQCEAARMTEAALLKDIDYASRCGHQADVPALRSALADTRGQISGLCR